LSDRSSTRNVIHLTYNSIQNSLSRFVSGGPRNVQIHKPQQLFFGQGDKLACSAASSRQSNYYWTAGSSAKSGQEYVIDICDFASRQQPRTVGNVKHYTVSVTCVVKFRNRSSSTSVDVDVAAAETDINKCGKQARNIITMPNKM